jgi:hypothetical protein
MNKDSFIKNENGGEKQDLKKKSKALKDNFYSSYVEIKVKKRK